jgi:hypothetical protein
MKRLRVHTSGIRAALVDAFPGSSPAAKAHLALLKWAAGILRGQHFTSASAIETALYVEQRKFRVPNSEMCFVLRDLSKEIYARIEDLRSVGIAA